MTQRAYGYFNRVFLAARRQLRGLLQDGYADVRERRAPAAHFLETPLDRSRHRFRIIHPFAVAAGRLADLRELDIGR